MKLIISLIVLFAYYSESKDSSCVGSKDPNCGVTVEVGVYIESICPDSRNFVNNQLFPTYNKLIVADPPIMTINLVPFGNAQMTFNKNSRKNPSLNFTCQHKAQECEGNIIQSCAVVRFDIEKSLAFINCMFNSTEWRTPWNSAAECAQKLKLNFDTLSECANSLDGIAVEYFMAGQTLALEPKHNWIPWVTINGQHTDEIQQKAETNLLGLVCDSYPGVVKPEPCKTAH